MNKAGEILIGVLYALGCVAVVVVGAFLLVCVVSSVVQSHGAGEMVGYITTVSRIGDRVFVTVKDSPDASNTYDGCVSSEDEQKFKDAIGRKVSLEWDGVFSLAPFWTECPAPARIIENKEEQNA